MPFRPRMLFKRPQFPAYPICFSPDPFTLYLSDTQELLGLHSGILKLRCKKKKKKNQAIKQSIKGKYNDASFSF